MIGSHKRGGHPLPRFPLPKAVRVRYIRLKPSLKTATRARTVVRLFPVLPTQKRPVRRIYSGRLLEHPFCDTFRKNVFETHNNPYGVGAERLFPEVVAAQTESDSAGRKSLAPSGPIALKKRGGGGLD